jgi:hypothetical protein
MAKSKSEERREEAQRAEDPKPHEEPTKQPPPAREPPPPPGTPALEDSRVGHVHPGQPGAAAGAGGPSHGQGLPSQDPQVTVGPHPGEPARNREPQSLPPSSEAITVTDVYLTSRGAL